MSRRLLLLVGLMIGVPVVAGLEWLLFRNIGPMRAIFAQVSIFAILAALGVVLARNLIHCGLFLVAFFFLIACQFVLLEAEFLAAMQVLVYIGAVSILLMFGIMLTRNVQGDDTTTGRWTAKLPAALIASGLLATLIYGVLAQRGGNGWSWNVAVERTPVAQADGTATPIGRAVNDMAPALGADLMTRWVIPFELAGLLLTAALVGAVALTRGDDDELDPTGTDRRRRDRSTDIHPDGGNGGLAQTHPAPAEPVAASSH